MPPVFPSQPTFLHNQVATQTPPNGSNCQEWCCKEANQPQESCWEASSCYQGISKLCYYRSLRDLRAVHNAWRMQANANNAAKHAQNLADWQLRCEALPPGAQKPKWPVQTKLNDTLARYRGVSRRKKPAERHVVGDSDEWDEDEGDEEAE